MRTSIELSWAAGFFDGEGSSSISFTDGRPYIHVGITQSANPETLLRFKDIVGIGKVRGPYHSDTRKGRKPVYRLQFQNFHHAQAVIAMLWPWLSQVKREQYRKCAGFLKERRNAT